MIIVQILDHFFSLTQGINALKDKFTKGLTIYYSNHVKENCQFLQYTMIFKYIRIGHKLNLR